MQQQSKRRHEGYLMIDHRASPGLPAPGMGEGQLYETATITCVHCQTVVILSPTRTRARGYCQKCDHYVCDKPECNIDCTPWNKIIDAIGDAGYHASGLIVVPEQINRVLAEPKSIEVAETYGGNRDG